MTKCRLVFYSPHIADAELCIYDGTDQLYYYSLSRAAILHLSPSCYLILSYLFLSFQKKIYQRPDAEYVLDLKGKKEAY